MPLEPEQCMVVVADEAVEGARVQYTFAETGAVAAYIIGMVNT